jgi:DNA invertase Pin-like site-specific DNA recombinase
MAIYGYVHVSSLQQANEGDSLETQLKQIGNYASLKDYEVPPENFITERGTKLTSVQSRV